MTPVDATMMSSPFIPSSAARAAQVFSAFAYPSGVQALAFPLLQIAARATPFVRCALVHSDRSGKDAVLREDSRRRAVLFRDYKREIELVLVLSETGVYARGSESLRGADAAVTWL